MTFKDSISRRRILELGGVSGLSLFAGCGGQANSSQSSDDADGEPRVSDTETEADTVVFTESPTTTDVSSELVFDGGNLQSFIDALNTASTIGNATLRVDPGTYRFGPVETAPPGEKDPHAEARRIQDVTIDGSGATFIFTNPLRTGLQFVGGRDITVQGLTIDYEPLPFTQGEIVGVSDNGKTITLAIDDQYPSLSHDMFAQADRVWASVHEADGSLISGIKKENSFDKFFSETAQTGERQFTLTIQNSSRGIETGRRLTIVARNNGTALDFYKVDRPTIEDVTVHASGGSAFGASVCSDPVIRGATVVPPSDSNRQIATDADGIRFVNCISSATITDCQHERLLDDSIVVQHTFAEVTEIIDSQTIRVEDVHPFVVAEGDTLGVQSVSGARKGSLPPISEYRPRFTTLGRRQKPAEITFEEEFTDTVSEGDFVGNEATGTQNFVVSNNELYNHRGILIRVTAGPGKIENNTLVGASRNAVELESDTDQNFSPKGWCHNVTVRNNKIRRAGLAYFAGEHPAAIRCHHLTFEGTPTEGQPHRNINIIGNDIANCASLGIDVEASQNVRIEDNSIRRVNQLGYPSGSYGVALSNVADVTVRGNQVSGSDKYLTEFGRQSDTENLDLSSNQFFLGDDSVAATFRQWLTMEFNFNRAVQPDGGRYLTVRCYKIRLRANGVVQETYNIGVKEQGLQLENGYFSPETSNSGTWRWFGGENAITTIGIPAQKIANSDRLEIKAKSIEPGLSGNISIGGESVGEITLDTTDIMWYGIDLP